MFSSKIQSVVSINKSVLRIAESISQSIPQALQDIQAALNRMSRLPAGAWEFDEQLKASLLASNRFSASQADSLLSGQIADNMYIALGHLESLYKIYISSEFSEIYLSQMSLEQLNQVQRAIRRADVLRSELLGALAHFNTKPTIAH